jgi:hypothetical protein
MQCACAVLSFVACPAEKIFPHDLMNGTVFTKVTEYEMCFHFLYNFVSKNPHSMKNSVRYDQKYILVICLRVKYPLFWSDFIKIKIFHRFSKNAQNPTFMKIR